MTPDEKAALNHRLATLAEIHTTPSKYRTLAARALRGEVVKGREQ